MNLTFGQTPIRNEDTGQELPWIYILIGAVAFFILLSFSTINAFGAIAGSGLWLVFAGTFFNNLPEVGTLGSASLIIGGFFLVVLAIIAALGGYGR
jgi:ABC-type phosphate transport system permease subunit